jgi:molecular chaperone GrpE
MEDKEKESSFGETAPEEKIEALPVEAAEAEVSVEAAEAGGPDETENLKNRLAYLTAEFDNFRKRAAREREAQAAFGNERLLSAVLPFLDNLERAMSQEGASTEAVLAGVRMTYDLFLAELRKFGLEQFASEGNAFDPSRHEAIGSVPWEGKPEGTVLSEMQKGYLLNGRLLRPAQVMVAAAPPGDKPEELGN